MKAALKKLKLIPALVCLCAGILAPVLYAADSVETCHAIEEGAVILYQGDSARRIPVEGRILCSARAAAGVYYCAERGGKGAGGLYLGFVDFQSGSIGFERNIPAPTGERAIMKIMAGDGAAYLLAGSANDPAVPGELIRIPAAPGEVSRAAGIIDFYVEDADCFILKKTDSGPQVVLNEISVPLLLPGEGPFRISGVLDKRLVLVNAGDFTEVIDIRTGKSLYQYATGCEFLEPEGYNMIIQAVDVIGPDHNEREMIFYKVIIDGVETGRTDSGPAGLAREMKLMLEPNRYHHVRLERWVLNPGKGRYDRENNIRQPRMKEIYMPMNRIVKLVVSFDNKDYLYNIAPVYR